MDHQRVNFDESRCSCGVGELSRLSDDVGDNLFAIATMLYHPARGRPKAYLIFSNLADVQTNGHRLAKEVDKRDFGKVWQSSNEINPNTGNVICLWIWHVNHEKYREFYKQERINKLKK